MQKDTFESFGESFQEKIVCSILQDGLFADQLADVIKPRYFTLKHLERIVEKVYDHKGRYKTFPSPELVEVMITQDERDELVVQQAREYLGRVPEMHLNGDSRYVQDKSLDFCKQQAVKEAIIRTLDVLETPDSNYDSISSIMREALSKGATRDLGHEYNEGFDYRTQKSVRRPISTGWPTIDKELNGGWERQTLVTFIAPTGAGKSMFLCNVSAAAVAQGLNSLYVSLEMADFKIGLRHDSYYSGVSINDVPTEKEKVESAVRGQVQGRLIIKEFPTKTASVQTIRSYMQRLEAVKGFRPDILVVDYADLLRPARFGEKRHELEGIYEELRGLAQEFNIVVITADQTNRAGLNDEIVTLQSIAESYAKATVCDVIMTISRRMEDKQTNSGRLFIAKSRLGRDGVVYPFVMNPATVKVRILNQNEDPIAAFVEGNKNLVGDRFKKLMKGHSSGSNGGETN
jgi:replicative DNA helicase